MFWANPGWWGYPNRAALDAAASGGGYQGPGDVVGSAISFWGMRGYNAAYATPGTNPCMDVVDAGLVSHTINILSTGFVDVATLNGLTGPLRINKLYDQVGTNHLIASPGASNRLLLTLNVIHGLPAIETTGNTDNMETGNVTMVQPLTISWVGNRVANTTTFVEGPGWVGGSMGWNSAANQPMTFAGTVLGATVNTGAAPNTVDGVFHAFQSVFNSTTSDICVDGVSTTGNAGTNAPTAEHLIFPNNSLWGARFTEFGIWGSAFNSTQKANMNSNQHGANGYNF